MLPDGVQLGCVTKEQLEYLETKIGDSAEQHVNAKACRNYPRNSPWPYEFFRQNSQQHPTF